MSCHFPGRAARQPRLCRATGERDRFVPPHTARGQPGVEPAFVRPDVPRRGLASARPVTDGRGLIRDRCPKFAAERLAPAVPRPTWPPPWPPVRRGWMSARRPANDSDASANREGDEEHSGHEPSDDRQGRRVLLEESTLVEVALPTRAPPSEAVGPTRRPKAAVSTAACGRGPLRIPARPMV
jgi:hypothetical protein